MQPFLWFEDVIFTFSQSFPGLARMEDFPYITYYCPHCHALNRPKNLEQPVSGSRSPEVGSLRVGSGGSSVSESPKETVATNTSATAESDIVEAAEESAAEESVAG